VIRRLSCLALVIAVAGCHRGTTVSHTTTTTPTPSPTATIPTPPAPTMEGPAAGLCTTWTSQPIDLSALPALASDRALHAENDGRGGITLAAMRDDGTIVAVAFAIDGTTRTTTFAPPSLHAAARQVLAAPNGGWVVVWDETVAGISIVAYDAAGVAHVVDTSEAPYAQSQGLRVGVSEDGYVGVIDAAGVRWWSIDGAHEQIAYDAALPIEITGHGALRWLDGELVFASNTPSPEVGAIERDASYTLSPAPQALTGAVVAVVGQGARSSAFLQGLPGTYTPVGTPIEISLLAEGRARDATLDVPIDVWGGATARTASEGAVLVFSDRGLTGGGGAPAHLVEVAPDGMRGPVFTIGTAPVAPTNMVVASTADGDAMIVVEWNGSVRSGWLTRCAPVSP
jgi:hypothetical protein